MTKNSLRWWGKLAAGGLAAALAVVYGVSGYVGWQLTHPARKPVTATPSSVGLTYADVDFLSRVDQLRLQGWLMKAPENRLTVICAHGYRQNRLQQDVPLLALTRELTAHGANVLMFDFRNCGASEGTITSVGQYEVRDVLGAIDFVRTQPELNQKVVLLGFSMGAAAVILAGAQETSVAAVVADSPFADLTAYLEENFSVWTDLPAVPFNRTILAVLPGLTGLEPDKVSPVREIARLNGRPLLLIHGEGDTDIAISNSERLQQAYPAAHLLRIPGAPHVKGFQTDRTLYLTELTAFLASL